MHITLVSPYDPAPTTCAADRSHVGGVERVFLNVSRGLARRGHDVTLLCSTRDRSSEADEHGIHVVRGHRYGTLLGTPLVHLANRIPKDADLVHVAATYPFTTPPVLRAATRLRIPSVVDFHFEPHPASRWGRTAASLYGDVGPPAYALAQAAMVRSLAHGRSARGLSWVPESRWRVVPNGIDPSVFQPRGEARDGAYLLFVGRLVPYKGVRVLLHALARQRDPLPLLIAGDGPGRPRLEATARALGVDATFLGRVPDEHLPALYRGARLTVLPSVVPQESFGITLIESMACGTPVVASDLAGVSEVARLGGLLAIAGDVASLSDQILRAADPDVLPRGGKLAARIHEQYSWNAVTRRVLEVYDEVTARPHGAPAGVTHSAHPRRNPVL